MNDLQAICENINDHPKDHFLWTILADFLEESGDTRSVGLWLLIREERKPYYFTGVDLRCWGWCATGDHVPGSCRLPEGTFLSVLKHQNAKQKHDWHSSIWADFDKLSEALLAAAEACAKI